MQLPTTDNALVHLFSVTSGNIAVSDISLKTRCFGLHFCGRKFGCIFGHFYAMCPEGCWIRWNNAK